MLYLLQRKRSCQIPAFIASVLTRTVFATAGLATKAQRLLAVMTVGVTLAWSQAVVADDDSTTDKATNAERITQPYHASYMLSRRGTERGEATRSLEQTEQDEWRYVTSTRARMLILSDRRQNETHFKIHEGRVQPLLFDYAREGTGSNQYLRIRFDYENEQVISAGDNEVNVEWQAQLLDPNAVLHQLQIDVAGEQTSWTYPLVDERGNYRDYEFARSGTERVTTPYGTFDTIQVERVRDHNRRQTLFWFAPELNYTLVKMQQIEDNREQLQIQLKELSFDKQEPAG